MLSVVRWFVSSLYGSYHERCANGTEKKPYNPVLGEQFLMDWSDSGNEGWESMHLICEQGNFRYFLSNSHDFVFAATSIQSYSIS